MPNWAKRTFCSHGKHLEENCDKCELIGLEESIKWMSKRLINIKNRRDEIQKKLNTLNKFNGD